MAKLSKHIYTPAQRAKKVAGRSSKGKKQHYSLAERRAFWIGVGISNAQHDNADLMLHTDSAIRESVRAGYHADNIKDMSHKLKQRPTKKTPKKGARGRR